MKAKEYIKYTDFLAFYFHQRVAYLLLIQIKDTKITPNQVTLLALIFGLFSAFSIIIGEDLLAVILLQLSFVLDCLDGQLARYKKMSSNLGMWLDNLVDRVVENSIVIALSFHFNIINIGIYLVFINMFFSYISDLEIYQNVQYKKLTQLQKLIFSPIYLLHRSFVTLLLSISIFLPEILLMLVIIYIYGIIFKIYRKFYGLVT